MIENPYQGYLKELTETIIDLAVKTKRDNQANKFPFNRGILFAYADLLDRMKQQAIFFDVDEKAIGLRGLKPLKRFLNIED